LKAKENQWRKDKAVYEQKIELLEIQIRESKLREENLKNMNENIMSALNDMSSDNKPFVVKNFLAIVIYYFFEEKLFV
jgi:hypothetical protein